MHKLATFFAITLIAASIAGCATNEAEPTPTTGTPATTPTPTATPTAEPTPVLTPTVPVNLTNGTGPTSIEITSYEPRADAGSDALVCWRVEGSGTIPHTAIHFDNESHAGDNVTFAAYDGGAVYPDNATAAAITGYALPGDFCAAVAVPQSGKLYYRAHAMLTPAGIVSDEEWTAIKGNATNVTITSSPANLTAGAKGTVCWSVAGTGNVAHTAIHFDNESHAGDNVTFAAYDGGAAYPANATALDPMGYDLPGAFCTDLTMPATGSLYYRAHVIDAAGAPGRVSAESTTTASA